MHAKLDRLTLPVIAAAIFIITLVVRLIFLWQWSHTTYAELPLLDAMAYDQWAQNILDGKWLRDRAFYQSPLYPYVLAILYGVFGHSLLAASLFNVFLGALTCAGLSLIAGRSFGKPAALLTGLLAVFYRPLIFYSVPILKEALGLCLVTFFVLFALQAIQNNRYRNYVLSGFMFGLAALVRSNILLIAPVFLLVALIYWRRSALLPTALFLFVTSLVILPVTLHNAIVSHDFVPISYGGGLNFYLGNSPIANGANIYLPNVSSDPLEGEEQDVSQIAQASVGHSLLPSEISNFWFRQGLDFISHNPWGFLMLMVNKIWLFWDDYEHGDNYEIEFITDQFRTVLSCPLPGFWLVSLLAAFGIATLWRPQHREAILLTCFAGIYMMSVVMFYVTDRYRLPVVIFLLPLAGGAYAGIQHAIENKAWANLTTAFGLAAISVWLAFSLVGDAPTRTAINWGILAGLQSDLRQDQQALNTLRRGLAISSQVGASSLMKGSVSAERLGHLEEAKRLLEIALNFYPMDGRVYYHYGRFWSLIGNLPQAQIALERAIELAPGYILSYVGLAKVYAKMGNQLKARQTIQRGFMVDPANPLLIHALQ